jgi:hypothetical protein
MQDKNTFRRVANAVGSFGKQVNQVAQKLDRLGFAAERFGSDRATWLAVKQGMGPALRMGTSVILSWHEGIPLPPAKAKVPLELGEIRPNEHDQVVALLAENGWPSPVKEAEARWSNGHRCFAARHQGKVVAQSWISRERHNVEELWDMQLDPYTEARLYDSYTARSSRGLRILGDNLVALIRALTEEGMTWLHTSIGGDNVSSLKAVLPVMPVRQDYRYFMTRGMKRPVVIGLNESARPTLVGVDRPFECINVTNLALD